MSLHTADISSRLSRFLSRRQAPRRVEGKPQAEADEIAALVACIQRYAPRSDDALASWWPRFEALLGEAGSGLWPTEKEAKEAAVSAAKEAPKSETWKLDEYEVIGKRMSAGEAVEEGYLYGRQAAELIRRGLVDETTMRKYRSAAYFSRKEVYTQAAATAWEDEAKDRHDAAREMAKAAPRKNFDTSVPDKTSPAKGMAA